jgi:predicted SAM-dependent methyltransferase
MDEHQASAAQPDAQDAFAAPAQAPAGLRRLNWGCGEVPEPGWINSDLLEHPDIELVCDIRDGLPLENESIDYAASVHALPEIPYPDLVPTLRELRRVLKPGGVLRLCLPDLDRAIAAYHGDEREYFLIPDEEVRTTAGKMIVQIIWYGHSRSLFTGDFIEELLTKAGFSKVTRCAFQQTASPFAEIIWLDNREGESLFVEATK